MNYFNPFVFYERVPIGIFTVWYEAAGWVAIILVCFGLIILIKGLNIFENKKVYLSLGLGSIISWISFSILALRG